MKLLYSYMRRLCAYITDRLYQFKRFLLLSIDGLGLSCPVFTKVIGILPVALVCFQFVCLAQESRESGMTGIGEIKPLIVGQKVPEEFWSREHLFYVNGDTVRKNLEDYEGKLLLLDFWATWCGPCLVGINNLNNWRQEFPDITFLLVSAKGHDDNLARIASVLSTPTNLINEDIQLPCILYDEYLSQLFPSTSVPLYIWINRKGRIHALTSSYFMNRKQLKKWIALQ